jgi:hypothetical protein
MLWFPDPVMGQVIAKRNQCDSFPVINAHVHLDSGRVRQTDTATRVERTNPRVYLYFLNVFLTRRNCYYIALAVMPIDFRYKSVLSLTNALSHI